LLVEFPNKPFELIPTVFIVLETCVFSLSSKRKKSHNKGNAVHWNFTHSAQDFKYDCIVLCIVSLWLCCPVRRN